MSQEFKNINDAFSWIESFTNLEKDAKERKRHYRPERMAEVLEHFGNPHLSCRVIHTAGSKGKGSTSVLMASALTQNGWKTGLYTSPHVLHYKERIQIDSSSLEDQKYIDCITSIKVRLDIELPGGTEPTTFEILTLLAFLLFKEENCDFCVIETGLGGRLDATNVVKPEASVLTPIELEHTQWLGNSIEAIAGEKAGIIKPDTPVFSSPQKAEVESIFRQTAVEKNAVIYVLNEKVKNIDSSVSCEGTKFTINYRDGKTVQGKLALTGHIQAWNAALAFSVLTTLYPDVDESVWLEGFSKAVLPGRMEILSKDPLIVLDGSHTPRSVTLALESFNSISDESARKILLFACQDDKDAEAMAEILSSEFSKIVITTPGFFKKSSPERVYNAFSTLRKDCILEVDPGKALKLVQAENMDILIMGSFILAGAIKQIYGVQ
jgi:dihydrofolate synthase / folylpolyglutamate synthase